MMRASVVAVRTYFVTCGVQIWAACVGVMSVGVALVVGLTLISTPAYSNYEGTADDCNVVATGPNGEVHYVSFYSPEAREHFRQSHCLPKFVDAPLYQALRTGDPSTLKSDIAKLQL